MFHSQCQPKTKSIHKKNTAKDKQQGKLKGFEKGFIRIIDDTGEDYLYDPEKFEIIED